MTGTIVTVMLPWNSPTAVAASKPRNWRPSPPLVAPNRSWVDGAACRAHPEPELWWPVSEAAEFQPGILRAKLICWHECPVRELCLAEAPALRSTGAGDGGIYAGPTDSDRAKRAARSERRADAGAGER